jgi:hypothetical protein
MGRKDMGKRVNNKWWESHVIVMGMESEEKNEEVKEELKEELNKRWEK